MRMSKGHAVNRELAIHGRFDPRTYYAIEKKGAMNTAIAIRPITAPNHIPFRDARPRFGLPAVGAFGGAENSGDTMEIIEPVEVLLYQHTGLSGSALRDRPKN